jgi:hypothetical protein
LGATTSPLGDASQTLQELIRPGGQGDPGPALSRGTERRPWRDRDVLLTEQLQRPFLHVAVAPVTHVDPEVEGSVGLQEPRTGVAQDLCRRVVDRGTDMRYVEGDGVVALVGDEPEVMGVGQAAQPGSGINTSSPDCTVADKAT